MIKQNLKLKTIIAFLIIMTISIGICGYIVKSVYDNGAMLPLYEEDEGRLSVEVVDDAYFEQVVNIDHGYIKGFAFNAIFDKELMIGDRVILSAFDINTGELLGSREQNTGNFFKGELVRFKFPSEFYHSGGDIKVTLQFTSVDFEGGLYLNTVNNNVDMYVISPMADSYFKLVVFVFIAMLIMIALCFILMFIKNDIGLEWAYLPVGLVMGVVFCLIIPVMQVPDEAGHIYTAYQASNAILGIGEGENTTVLMRADDYNKYFQTFGVDRMYMDGLYEDVFDGVKDASLVPTGNYPSSSQMYLYIPSTIGITIGRLINASTLLTFILGRLFNVLVFVGLTFYAIRRMPFAKPLIIIWSIIPTTLQQTSSISRDSIIFALCAVVIALTMHLMYSPEKNSFYKRKLITLIIFSLLLLPAKSFAYSFVALFPIMLVIPKLYKLFREKTSKIKPSHLIALVVGVICLIILLGLVLASKVIGIMVPGMSLLRFAKLLINTAIIQGDNYVFGLLGANLGWLDLIINKYFVLPFLICLIIGSFARNDMDKPLNIYVRAWMLIVFLITSLVSLLGMLSAWTPDAYNYIEGVQGRHFLAALILLFLPFHSNKLTIEPVVEKYTVMIGVFCEIIVVTGIVLAQI